MGDVPVPTVGPASISPMPDTSASAPAAWSIPYIRARALEGRLYPDAMVAVLPEIPSDHPLAAEWRLRADSMRRLVDYLARLPRDLRIVEVGCGNGWLSNALGGIPGAQVTGIDANALELEQAQRVFGSRPNLRFVLGDAAVAGCPIVSPTVIVLASVIQYVDDLDGFLRRLLGWLAPGGEIHVLDSPIYSAAEIAAARSATRRHYEAIGVPEMAGFYHHHTWAELDALRPDLLYRPDAFGVRAARRLGRARSPFPWLRIRPR